MIGYPRKVPKRKLKKDISGNWNSYKLEYEKEKETVMNHNQEYNMKEKRIKRILVKLVVDKYLKIEIIRIGKGMYGSWKEKYHLYKKSQKIINGEKKIKL